MKKTELKSFLNRKVEEYNKPSFIDGDPIFVPHLFTKKQDIEISGFFAAIFAWGIRTTIIKKSTELMKLMDNAPHDFIVNHREKDRKRFEGFCHRTFNDTDLLYFLSFLQHHYKRYDSLEQAFLSDEIVISRKAAKDNNLATSTTKNTKLAAPAAKNSNLTTFSSKNTKLATNSAALRETEKIESCLNYFYAYFFSLDHVPPRTRKHIAAPMKNSACKRINMYLRWMVRNDNKGVDFGIWKKIKPSQLICPLDVHVARVAKRFDLLDRPNSDWKSAIDLTEHLRRFDPEDPVKYDFALFALGVIERF